MNKLKLIFATFVAVFAAFTGGKALADGYTLTINEPVSGHTYEAYQIFTGSLGSDGQLGNIQWGANVSDAGKSALGDASTVAETLSKATNNSTEAKNFATKINGYLTGEPAGTGPASITGLVAGYYLIKDKNDATSAYVLKVINDTYMTPKVGTPTVVKKVKDTNDTTGVTSGWQDSADHDINDEVPFQLTATLPDNYDSYNSYYLNFSDELSPGLTFNNDAKVYVVNGTERTEVTDYFDVAADGSSFAIKDLKQIAVDGSAVDKNSKIVVEYTATLDKEKAVIGSAGNPNTVKLIYSNNPNYTGDGETSPHGETPKDTVIVFTYKIVVNKVDQDEKPLVGAGFTLYKNVNGEWEQVKVISASEATSFEFTGLDDGEYKLSETTTPSGYNTIADITFTVEAEHETDPDAPQLTKLESGEIKFTRDTANEDALTTQVQNKKGSILPSTGSVGTTWLYLVGATLAIVAGVLLVTKKRMDS